MASFRETVMMYGRSGRWLLQRHIDLFLAQFLKCGKENLEVCRNILYRIPRLFPYITVRDRRGTAIYTSLDPSAVRDTSGSALR